MKFEKSYITLVYLNGGFKTLSKDEALELYLDYVNNFVSIQGFAEHYGIVMNSAKTLIKKFKI